VATDKFKIKNTLFRTALKIMGNRGLSKNIVGKIVRDYGIQNCRTNEITINGYKMITSRNTML
jgi:hypothetical protein